uniref:uncharacterized protein LOC120336224 n=1 Tax=Styela clava TaxID=7725 RepID=UPI00193A27EF|nr:uncharacterized protein LOC120336224 [Styela clava]
MFLFTFLLLFASLLFIIGQATNKHMICKEVNDVFNNNNGNFQPSARRLQGPMGKRGQPGLKGETGLQGASGQPGTVDYVRVAELVRIEVAKGIETKMKDLEGKIMTVSKITEGIIARELEQCESLRGGVMVDSKCFVTEFHSTRDTTLAEAEQICRNKGLRLADISTEHEHNAIMELVRNKISAGRSHTHVWTGMQRDKNGNAILSNGQISGYKRIREYSREYLTAEARRTHIYVIVRNDLNNADQGLGSIWPSYDLEGVVCSV